MSNTNESESQALAVVLDNSVSWTKHGLDVGAPEGTLLYPASLVDQQVRSIAELEASWDADRADWNETCAAMKARIAALEGACQRAADVITGLTYAADEVVFEIPEWDAHIEEVLSELRAVKGGA